ncbi:MAG: GGDEF domain-containing protein, partial [Acidimicrobiia bacterium]
MRHHRQASGLRYAIALAGAVVIVAAASVITLKMLGDRETAAEHRATAASELRLLLHRVDGVEWRAVAGEPVTPLQQDARRLFVELRDQSEALRSQRGADRALTTSLRRYRQGVTAELADLARGEEDAARRLHERVVDPSFVRIDALGARAERAAEINSNAIRAGRDRFEVGVVLLGFAIVAGILFFVSRSYRRGREREFADRQQRRFQSLIESSHDLVSTVDAEETVTFVSPNLVTVFPSITTSTISLRDLLPTDAVEIWRDAHANLNRTGKAVTCEVAVPSDDGFRTLETVGTRLDAEPGSTVWIWRDVTERRELEDQLAHQAFHDPLTGLANRALLQNRIEHVLTGARRSGRSAVLLIMDLDGFKAVNDELGQATGDALLTVIA